jgi:hypothetical protein
MAIGERKGMKRGGWRRNEKISNSNQEGDRDEWDSENKRACIRIG